MEETPADSGQDIPVASDQVVTVDVPADPQTESSEAPDATDLDNSPAELENDMTTNEHHDQAVLDAIDRSQAMIEFDIDGTIRWANQNFLATVGYSLDEIEGQHHSMFVDPTHAKSDEYRMLWQQLARGKCQQGMFKRINKAGEEIWLQASYNTITDDSGNVTRVVELASDISDFGHAVETATVNNNALRCMSGEHHDCGQRSKHLVRQRCVAGVLPDQRERHSSRLSRFLG